MKLLFLLVGLLCSALLSAAETRPFEIPRSTVVEIKDSEGQRTYPLFIKLPKSYGKMPDRHYPVIYLTDAWYAFQIVSGATRYPMNAGKMQEAIIVGISWEKGSRGDLSRVRDFTPSNSRQWRKQTGGAARHLAFIEQQVIPYIERRYRAEPADRTFVGNSLGGLFGSYILLTKPQLFHNYILGSPSYWFDDKAIFALEAAFAKHPKPVNARVFIGIGERETKALESRYEMVEDARAFHRKLLAWQQPGLEAKLMVFAEANHETAFPATAIQGLHWIYRR